MNNETQDVNEMRAKLAALGAALAGGEEVEAAYMALFEVVAGRLLGLEPAELLALVQTARTLPLAELANQYKVRYFEAVALAKCEQYGEALAAYDGLLGEALTAALRARTLNARSVSLRLTGHLEEALTGYAESLALWQSLGDVHYQGIVTLNMGIAHYELQNYGEATSYLTHAQRHFEAEGNAAWVGAALNELGLVLRDLGRWEEALNHFNRVIAQKEAEGAADQAGIGWLNVGEIYLFQGKLAEAVASLERALAAMTTRVYAVDVYLGLGLARAAEGAYEAAREAFATAVALAEEIERRDILPNAYFRLGELAQQMGEDTAALAAFDKAIACIEATREPVRDEGIKISLLGRWQQVYEAAVLLLLEGGAGAAAFELAERARARAFAEGVAQTAAASLTEIQGQLGDGERLISYFTTGVLENDVPLLRAIPPDNPLRRHLLTAARTLRFVIGPDGVRAADCGLDPNMLGSASPRGHDARRFLDERIRPRLAQALLAGAELEGATRLVVVPHGPLHHVPFGALVGSHELSIAPSGTIWAGGRGRARPRGQGCVAVGFAGEAGDLRYVGEEAAVVVGWLGGRVMEAAAVDTLREAAAGARFLHFACHGWFNLDAPLTSYLEVAQGVRLTAAEILAGWELSAELVVLSACRTGVSHVLRGDEPMGLIRAFLYAGARSVLVTQWAVEDLPTFLLMDYFYGRLAAGEASGRALLAAQGWLRGLSAGEAQAALARLGIAAPELVGERPFEDARHWAAFVLIG